MCIFYIQMHKAKLPPLPSHTPPPRVRRTRSIVVIKGFRPFSGRGARAFGARIRPSGDVQNFRLHFVRLCRTPFCMKKMHTQPDPVPAPHTRRAPLRPGISHRTRPPRIDWSRLDPQVAHLRDSGLSNRETARRLNLNVKTMETRLRHLRLHQAATHMALRGDEVRRACLNCDAAFIADGRFLRLCPTCRTMFG